MRALFLVAVLTFASPSFAKCMSSYWEVWPAAGSTLPVNGRVIIGAFGTATGDVEKLAGFGPALVATGHRVALAVKQTNVGEMKVSQAVLVPVEPLKPGLHYALTWKKTPPGFSLPANWNVAASRDDVAPTWKSAPVALSGEHAELGCGPADNAFVKVDVDDEATLIRARVLRGAKSTEYLLPWKAGERLAIGHGMCSGAFVPTADVWKLELSVVDVAGNEAVAPGAALQFKSLDPLK